jgi:S1-C subfamily serine protease
LSLILANLASARESRITGKIIMPMAIDNADLGGLNEMQSLYVKSSPAVAKILVYADYSIYLPKVVDVDFSEYNRKIDWGIEPDFATDVKVISDPSQNMYDYWGQIYGYESAYKNEGLWYGSGFLISPDGYVLTNAHVATVDEKLYEELMKNYTLIITYYTIDDSYNAGQYPSYYDYAYDLAVYNFMLENLKVDISNIAIKVVVGVDDPGKGTRAVEYAPQIIDSEGGDIFYTEAGLDWALLKIDGANFPYLKLGDSDTVSVGSNIVTVGYPSVSEAPVVTPENIQNLSYDLRTDVEPTFTKGYVSYIRPISGGYKSFQTDMSLSGGNSGGPVFDANGEVIGIATYGYDYYQGGNYNYVLRINDIKDRISDKVNLQQNIPAQSPSEETSEQQAAKSSSGYIVALIISLIIISLLIATVVLLIKSLYKSKTKKLTKENRVKKKL